jgi:lysozyme
MKGIDISNYQGTVNFAKVKASGVEIVYIKATEGLTVDNACFDAQYDGAKKAGLLVGAYHFLRDNNPIEEAEHFLSVVTGLPVDCKYMVDVEVTLGQTVVEISNNVRLFANYLIGKGKEVCLYTFVSFYNDSLNATVKDIPLWIADYEAKCTLTNTIGVQYSNSGVVAGITGKVDLDNFTDGILIAVKPLVIVEKPVVEAKPVVEPIKVNEKTLAIQKFLNSEDFTDDKDKKLTEDGIAGPCTVQAVGKLTKSL